MDPRSQPTTVVGDHPGGPVRPELEEPPVHELVVLPDREVRGPPQGDPLVLVEGDPASDEIVDDDLSGLDRDLGHRTGRGRVHRDSSIL
jgi:hypothetical protein